MRERDFQTEFTKWLKYRHYKTGAYELKLTKNTSLPFNALARHQRDALYHAKHGHVVFKIPDDSVGQKPFDAFMLVNVPAYVAVMFYERGQKEFYLIDIDMWVQEEDLSTRKSLTPERAAEIGQVCTLN